MKLKSAIAIALALNVLNLAACSKDDSGKKDKAAPPTQSDFPQKLNPPAPAVGADLTRDQIDQIKSDLGRKPRMTLPELDMVFPPKEMSENERRLRLDEIRRTNPAGYALILEMRKTCRKSNLDLKVDVSFPQDDNTLKVVKAGDHVEANTSTAVVGTECPLVGSAGYNMKGKVLESDETKFKAESGLGANLEVNVQSEKYAKLLGARGLVLEYGISGLAISRRVEKNGVDNAHVRYNVNGKYLMLSKEIPFSVVVEAVGERTKDNLGKGQATLNVDLNYPGIPVHVVIVTNLKEDGTSVPEKIWVNGHEKTADDLKELFGNDSVLTEPSELSKSLM